MQLFQFFLEDSSAAALNAGLFLAPAWSSNAYREKDGMFVTWPKVINYLIQTYATGDVIAKTDAALTRYSRPPGYVADKACRGASDNIAPFRKVLQ